MRIWEVQKHMVQIRIRSTVFSQIHLARQYLPLMLDLDPNLHEVNVGLRPAVRRALFYSGTTGASFTWS